VGTGGYLQRFMVYDFAALAVISTCMLIWYAMYSAGDTIMFRNTLSFISMAWALCSWPFLIYHIPIIGQALSTPYITGYSTLGILCPKLPSRMIVKKDNMAKERAKQQRELEKAGKFARWWHYSTARRTTNAVLDAVNPFDQVCKVS